MEKLVLRYGVIAIFLGAGIEGEPFALAGGVLAHRHWLPTYLAAAASIGDPARSTNSGSISAAISTAAGWSSG